MKLIATRDIRNVPALRLKDENGQTVINSPLNDEHIHRGSVFEIGTPNLRLNNADLLKMRKTDAAAAETVSMLVHAECVADALDEKAVKAVKDAIAADERKEDQAKKLDDTARNAAVVDKILSAAKAK